MGDALVIGAPERARLSLKNNVWNIDMDVILTTYYPVLYDKTSCPNFKTGTKALFWLEILPGWRIQ
jgi:hypothetical protein